MLLSWVALKILLRHNGSLVSSLEEVHICLEIHLSHLALQFPRNTDKYVYIFTCDMFDKHLMLQWALFSPIWFQQKEVLQ